MRQATFDLISYTISTFAFLSCENANTQIIYTDLDPDVFLQDTVYDDFQEHYLPDLNNDGTTDFDILHLYEWGSVTQGVLMYLEPDNYVLVETFSSIGYQPKVLIEGDEIGAGELFMHSFYAGSGYYNLALFAMNLGPYFGGGSLGLWAGGQTDKYFGVKLNFDGAAHYGWVRIDVAEGAASITIDEFAINMEPNASILAGETGDVASDQLTTTPEIEIICFDHQIDIHFAVLYPDAYIQIFDLQGRSIYHSAEVNEKLSINMEQLAAGIYLIQIKNGDHPYFKKIAIRR